MTKVHKVEGHAGQIQSIARRQGEEITPRQINEARDRFVGADGRADKLTGRDVVAFVTGVTGRSGLPKDAQRAKLAMEVVLRAAALAIFTPDLPKSEPSPGGSDPASGVS